MGRGPRLYDLDRVPRADATAPDARLPSRPPCQADMLILVIDGRQKNDQADAAFAQAWDRWFIEHPRSEAPPALVALTAVEGPEFGNGWHPPYDWSAGHGTRETAVRARIDALRSILPPSFSDFVAVGLSDQTSLRCRRTPPAGDRDALASCRTDGPAPATPRAGRPIEGRTPGPTARRTRPVASGQPAVQEESPIGIVMIGRAHPHRARKWPGLTPSAMREHWSMPWIAARS